MPLPKIKSVLLLNVRFLLVAAVAFAWGYLSYRDKLFPYAYLAQASAREDAGKDRLWAQRVIEGGYILHIRHAQRERWIDVTAFDAYELAKGIKAEHASFRRAVCLTQQGVEEAKLVGGIFEIAGVDVQAVISSPSCRARETAENAFGRIDRVSNSLIHRTALMKHQRGDFARQLRALLDGIDVETGRNVVLVGHSKTMSYNLGEVVNADESGGMDERLGTGILVLEKVGDQIIARHKFESITDFAHAVVEVPVE